MDDITNYDIIGDIHGRFDKLSALMKRMGYVRDGHGFVPPDGHAALFPGDLIDPKKARLWAPRRSPRDPSVQ